MAFVKDHPLFKEENQKDFISKEELPEIVAKCAKGDDEAIERMILSNIRLVIKIVSKYAFYPDDYEDMISEGMQALTRAVKKLNPSRMPTLRSYLSTAIKNGIIDYLNQHKATVRDKSKNHNLTIYSLNMPINNSDENSREEEIDCLVGKEKNPFDVLAYNNDIENLKDLIKILDKREQGVLRMYYGIGEERKTLDVIGKHYKVSKVRVSQINQEALNKIRNKIVSDETKYNLKRTIPTEFYFNGKTE